MPNNQSLGNVLRVSRRHLQVLHQKKVLELTVPRKLSDIVAGDIVALSENQIIEILPHKNLIKRSLAHRTKEVVANLDHLLIVAAPPPLFNTSVIDRLMTLCEIEDIPVSLIINKIDLGYEEIATAVNYYQNLVSNIFLTSAKSCSGIETLQQFISKSNFEKIAFAGISGVGKSSILKALLGVQEIRVADVSNRTGQGKQTTTEVQGYLIPNSETIIFDVPGIQNFGLAHLSNRGVKDSFLDFQNFPCPFSGCQHLGEAECSIKLAVKNGDILESRYTSYQQIIQELARNKDY